MSKYSPSSLLGYFSAPAGYEGSFGWMCGYSADARFLDAAAWNFTRHTAAQRSYTGKISLVAMLDPGQPQILPHHAPGILHVPLRGTPGFSLLHAKVALLCFRHVKDTTRWCLRLVVSTGNWTRQTLEQSLDLAWAVDVASESLKQREHTLLLDRADIAAAWDLLQWLQERFDLGALSAVSHGLTGLAREFFVECCRDTARGRLPRPRFFDSRKHSLLKQLPGMVRHHAGEGVRNTLVLGSGFFEAAQQARVPQVLASIVASLREKGSVTAKCEVRVVVEPSACQAVAAAVPMMRAEGWSIWPAAQPAFLGGNRRTLHAKFIFAAGRRSNSDACLNPWLYLGSGNLTAPGFQRACPSGNLEAGVLIANTALHWKWHSRSGLPAQSWLGHRLPVQWERQLVDSRDLAAGADMPDRPPAFEAPPIAWCRHMPADESGCARLELPAHEGAVEVLDTEGVPCPPCGPLQVAWPGPRQPSVVVQWQQDGRQLRCSIPVIDGPGRVAAIELPALDLESAWWLLQQFPQPPAEEEDAWSDEREFDPGTTASAGAQPAHESESAVRAMMRLIENIADKQVRIAPADWPAWCISMEQSLRQAADCPAVRAFVEDVALDPLHSLRQNCSLPDFAHASSSGHQRRYVATLDAIAEAWGTSGLPSAGAAHGDSLELG